MRTAASARATLISCVLLVVLAVAFVYRLTDGFEAWTFEARRAERVRDGTLHAAAVPLVTHAGQPARLWTADATQPAAFVVDFIYTRCPGVCSALGSVHQQMQRSLAARAAAAPAANGVRLVSISLDVARDDATALAGYASRFGADPARWTIAVPASAGAADVLLRSLEVVSIRDGRGGFVHNGAIHVVDARGRLRGLFELDRWPQALAAAERVAAEAVDAGHHAAERRPAARFDAPPRHRAATLPVTQPSS
jgi:protein SCO1/2